MGEASGEAMLIHVKPIAVKLDPISALLGPPGTCISHDATVVTGCKIRNRGTSQCLAKIE